MPYSIRPAAKGTMALIDGKLVDVDLLLVPVRGIKPRAAKPVKRQKRSKASIEKQRRTRAANVARLMAQQAADGERTPSKEVKEA